jgi:putative tricarboxylic transport membrane protein
MGIILGPMAEQYFLTSMLAHHNDLSIFVTRPVSAVILGVTALLILWAIAKTVLAGRRAALESEAVSHP